MSARNGHFVPRRRASGAQGRLTPWCARVCVCRLGKEDFSGCMAMLRRADAWCDPEVGVRCDDMRVLTLNNAACCHRRQGNLKSALRFLKRCVAAARARAARARPHTPPSSPSCSAAEIGTQSMEVDNVSVTYLNLCAVLSQLGMHEKACVAARARARGLRLRLHLRAHRMAVSHARLPFDATDKTARARLEHAQSAVFHCQEELMVAKEAGAAGDHMVTLAIAYHNLAVELEHTARVDMCLQWFKKALALARKHASANAALVDMFERSYQNVRALRASCRRPFRAR